LAPKDADDAPAELHPLIDICIRSWKALNPDWEVRVLNETTKSKWLDSSDLPTDYDKQAIQHKSDAVRIALLVKYGGVWIDASVFMLRPLEQILSPDPSVHNFMNLRTYWTQESIFEGRENYTHYVENWFMAVPPDDPLFSQVQACVKKLQPKLETWQPLAMTGLFSPRQLEEMFSMTINTYLSMHACFLKTLDEDAALWHWYNSASTYHINAGHAGLRLGKLLGWKQKGAHETKKRLFQSYDQELYDNLKGDEDVKMIKIGGKMRKVIWDLPRKAFWCEKSTFQRLFMEMGIWNEKECGPRPADDFWDAAS